VERWTFFYFWPLVTSVLLAFSCFELHEQRTTNYRTTFFDLNMYLPIVCFFKCSQNRLC
jgi:hypothetical protein